MTDAAYFRAFKRLEDDAKDLGFVVKTSKVDYNSLALCVSDDRLPPYSSNYELFMGTCEQLTSVIHGWKSATMYYSTLGILNEKKIKKAEEHYMQNRVIHKLKTGEDIPSAN